MRVPFYPGVYPPAPALEVRLINVLSGESTGYQHAILDTGADVTIVPSKILALLHLTPLRRVPVYGMWGGKSKAKVYLVDIAIGDHLRISLNVLESTTEKQILIGRDVSNHLRLLLDGPDLSVQILTD